MSWDLGTMPGGRGSAARTAAGGKGRGHRRFRPRSEVKLSGGREAIASDSRALGWVRRLAPEIDPSITDPGTSQNVATMKRLIKNTSLQTNVLPPAPLPAREGAGKRSGRFSCC